MELELSDTQVARRIGTGDDREAEADLCRRMAPRIRLYGLRHLRDAHAAEDLVQQVLITTLEALRAGRLRVPEKRRHVSIDASSLQVVASLNRQESVPNAEQFGVSSEATIGLDLQTTTTYSVVVSYDLAGLEGTG